MATALLTRFGYPKVPGDQPESIIDVTGPASWPPFFPTPIPMSGGQRITARAFGLDSLDFVVSMGSNDGRYSVVIVPDTLPPAPAPPLPTQLPDGAFGAIILIWTTIGGGQVGGGTDLSASTVRLFARGR